MQKKFFHVYGGNILDKYTVKLYARAYQDLEEIYSYIANSLLEPDTALNMVDALETAILSLAQFPERGAIRRVGAYSNKDYRQLFLKNYTIIYRIVKQKKKYMSLQYVILPGFYSTTSHFWKRLTSNIKEEDN